MNTPTATTTADRVDLLRRDKGLTYAEFSRQVGIKRNSLKRRLDGDLPFTILELEAVARQFGVPVASLLGQDAA